MDKDAVMELIRDEDRKRLAAIRMGSSNEPKKDYDENIFEEEPMKQARFKQYVQYLKRGCTFLIDYKKSLKKLLKIIERCLKLLV